MRAMQAGVFRIPPPIDTKIAQPEARITIDHDRVASLGLDMKQIGADLSAMVGGNFVNWFNISGRSYRVIPQVQRIDRLNADQLSNMYVTGPNNQLVPLSTIAKIQNRTLPRSLNRMQQRNSERIMGVPTGGVDAG